MPSSLCQMLYTKCLNWQSLMPVTTTQWVSNYFDFSTCPMMNATIINSIRNLLEMQSWTFAIIRIKIRGTNVLRETKKESRRVKTQPFPPNPPKSANNSVYVPKTTHKYPRCKTPHSDCLKTCACVLCTSFQVIFILTMANARDFASQNQPLCKTFKEIYQNQVNFSIAKYYFSASFQKHYELYHVIQQTYKIYIHIQENKDNYVYIFGILSSFTKHFKLNIKCKGEKTLMHQVFKNVHHFIIIRKCVPSKKYTLKLFYFFLKLLTFMN